MSIFENKKNNNKTKKNKVPVKPKKQENLEFINVCSVQFFFVKKI